MLLRIPCVLDDGSPLVGLPPHREMPRIPCGASVAIELEVRTPAKVLEALRLGDVVQIVVRRSVGAPYELLTAATRDPARVGVAAATWSAAETGSIAPGRMFLEVWLKRGTERHVLCPLTAIFFAPTLAPRAL